MPCLDDESALAMARGRLDGAALDVAIAHLDGCAACRLAVAAAAGDAAASTLGRFELEGVAGAGAMGIVYRARDPRLGRVVALKVIRPEALAAATRARFEREARALARISHPNVVSVHEVGDEGGALHLAMEHLSGGTLGDWLRAAPRRARDVVDKLVQAGEGLLAAHRAGLVHRDFKPANVLLDGAGRVRVTDFGLAHDGGELERGGELVDAGGDLLRTRTGMVVGTPAYMAPEQHDGRLADPRADQFAFAVTLYEALAGHRPFRAADLAALAAAVRAGRIEPPARPIPRPLARALRRALAPRAEDRWPSMRELLDELIAWQRGARGRWLLAGAAAIVVAAGAVTAAALGGPARHGAATATAPDAPAALAAQRADAEAWLERALEHRRREDPTASLDASHRALALAQASGHHEVARRAADNAAWQYLFGGRDATQAARWVGIAEQLDAMAPPSPREQALREILHAHLDERRGDVDAAIARLEAVDARVRAERLDAEPAVRALEGLAIMLLRARRWTAAAAWLDRLERDHTDDARARYVVARHRGALAAFAGRFGDAEPLLARAVELAPTAAERAGALDSHAQALAGLGRIDGPSGALARFDAAGAADPEGPDGPAAVRALCGRASTLLRARRWDEAEPPLTRCLEAREARYTPREPVVILTMVELATLHEARGRRDLAIDYLTRALDRFAAIGRDDATVQAVRARLARLKEKRR